MEDVLELETRRKIYDVLRKNPGVHLSKIADLLQMRVSHVEYHLNFLEKHDMITVEKVTGYKRFCIKGTIGVQDKQYLSVLRQKTLLHIILFLLKHNTVQHKDILENVPAGTYTVRAEKPGYNFGSVANVIVTEGGTTAGVNMSMAPFTAQPPTLSASTSLVGMITLNWSSLFRNPEREKEIALMVGDELLA